jgi:hypothetical protein
MMVFSLLDGIDDDGDGLAGIIPICSLYLGAQSSGDRHSHARYGRNFRLQTTNSTRLPRWCHVTTRFCAPEVVWGPRRLVAKECRIWQLMRRPAEIRGFVFAIRPPFDFQGYKGLQATIAESAQKFFGIFCSPLGRDAGDKRATWATRIGHRGVAHLSLWATRFMRWGYETAALLRP